MPPLQDLIIRLGLSSVGDLNRAVFAYPDSGLLDAIERAFGVEKAAAAREQVSAHTKIPLIPEEELIIDDSVLGVSALELAPIVTKFKAIPLRITEDNGERQLVLVLADPLVDEARLAFSELYELPIKCYMARERSIMNAYALTSAKLALAARKEASAHPDSNLPTFAKHVEDPEVKKAIQQLIATAVKHNASRVEIDTAHAFTKAQFTFADGLTSSVEISVSPTAVVASLVRRGQVVAETPTEVKASCRIRFKSVAVNFSLECANVRSAPEDLPVSVCKELYGRTVALRNFAIDNPENPGFWNSIYDGHASTLREMFEKSTGLFFVCSSKSYTRDFASRALKESYPDLISYDIGADFKERSDIFLQAGNSRVLVSMQGSDAFDALRQLAGSMPANLSLVRGILSYQQIPRNCPFCTKPTVPETDVLLRVPVAFNLAVKDFRSGTGCSVCDQKGVLGFVGVSSLLSFDGYAGQQLKSEEKIQTIFDAMAKDCFTPLLEDGLRTAGLGKTRLSLVLDEVPPPPKEYMQARSNAAFDEHTPKQTKYADAPQKLQLDTDGSYAQNRSPFANGRTNGSEQPLRGRDAFMRKPREVEAAAKAETDWLLPDPETKKIAPLPEKKQAKSEEEGRALLLVIDDDADQRSILRRVFEIAGYRVEVAADGIDGIVSAVRLEPELIIVDFMMPELDGRETIRRLKSGPTTGTIPIVALTAYADPDVELGLLQAGADDFCPKSVSKQVLLKRVERLVEK